MEQVAHTEDRSERPLAAPAHGLVLANFVGAVGAAVVYAVYRDRSRYVAFQAVQAAVSASCWGSSSPLAAGCAGQSRTWAR